MPLDLQLGEISPVPTAKTEEVRLGDGVAIAFLESGGEEMNKEKKKSDPKTEQGPKQVDGKKTVEHAPEPREEAAP